MKTASRKDWELHISPRWNFWRPHIDNYTLESMDANIFSAGSLIPTLTGLGFVLVCLSLWTRQGMQTAAGGSAFCGKGRYLRATTHGLSCPCRWAEWRRRSRGAVTGAHPLCLPGARHGELISLSLGLRAAFLFQCCLTSPGPAGSCCKSKKRTAVTSLALLD